MKGGSGGRRGRGPIPEVPGPPSGRGHPTTPLLGSPEKLPTWRTTPLSQLLCPNCGNRAGEGAWFAGRARRAPAPDPAPRGSQPMGLRSGAGAGRAGAQPRRDLCVLARDWRDRRARGLGSTRSRACAAPRPENSPEKGESLVFAPEQVPPLANGVGSGPPPDLSSRIRTAPGHLLFRAKKEI